MSNLKEKRPIGSHERKGIEAEMEVPVNLERVLLEAAQDSEFRKALASDRALALAGRGFRLRESEQAMLSALPQSALDKMVEQLRPEKLKKSVFAKHVITALAGSMIISTAACDGTTKGNAPDMPQDGSADSSGGMGGESVNVGGGGNVTRGVTADWPDAGPAGGGGVKSSNAGQGGTGARPDWPKDSDSGS